ncbi:hypothetical protein ACFE04_004047 [Oxalis oulophora]
MGKYIEDLDPETLNIGIFSGNVTLTNLKVKAEALYELGLPISVKKGIIGKVSLNIPWSRLCSQTSVISLEDIFILAGPVTCGKYDPEIEKKLLRAEKKRIIEQLDPSSSFLSSESPENFAETLIASILNNLKIFIRNVHIRYEDSFTNNSLPVSVGLCLHNFSIENTNSNWKPISHSSKMGSIYQVAKIKSLSIYCNANCSEMLLRNENETGNGDDWIHSLQHSLETFKFNKKESLDFDVAVQLSHKQYLALLLLFKSFHRISINRLYRKFHPEVPVSQAPKKWWKYAYDSVVHDKIMPFTWSRLMLHSAEDRMDLQKIEDTLDIYNIVLAREETKMKIHSEVPEKIVLKECSSRKWLFFENKSYPIKRPKLLVNDCKNGFLSQLSQTEKNCLYEMIGFLETHSSFSDKPKQYIKNKFNFTVANLSLSLSSGGSEVLVVTMSDILTSIETRPAANSYKISASVESVVVEGASVEYSLIPIISSDNISKGQDWKNYAKPCNSSYHMISKIHLHVVFSNSLKPDYKQLPRYKLNISLQKLRINMSDNRIITLMNFLDNLPFPRSHTILDNTDDLLMFDHIKLHNDLHCLETLQFFIAQADTRRLSTAIFSHLEETNKIYLNVDRSNVSSEISDEDSELWAKGLDLPGFDDNVSQNNVILYLFRINIAQIILELRRSANLVDKSYLVVKATNFCSDIAFMEYGPAMQISLGSINVVDKLHSSISSVRSDCPDFKSHFHNVEQSLVIGINPFQIVYHRDAIINLSRYLRYFLDKFRGHYVARIKSLALKYSRQIYKSWFKSNDPPIPPGATKFSYSACISCVTFNLCDTELDFLLIKISGFEIDFLFKANERLILRMFLATLSIDDISNTSLYPKVLTVDDGKLIEMKYDRRTPRAGKTNLELNQNDLKSDGQFKFHLGRVNVVLLYKLIVDTEKFFSPFISKHLISRGFRLIGKKISRFFGYLRFFSDKILVSIDCQLPTLLIPQHASSPNLLIFNTGDLTAENFFKEIHKEEYHTYKTSPVMDDTLIKMDAIFVSRGVVNLNGTIIVQISEDEALTTFDINMTLNKVNIHLGQKNLNTLNLIWRDNVRKTLNFLETDNGKKISFTRKEEADVRKLQAFLYQSESNRKDLVLRANFDGVELCLYRDIDEVLSSPVRDESRSLCKFKLGEIILQGQFFACSRSEIQISLQSFLLEDTRSIRDICIRRLAIG